MKRFALLLAILSISANCYAYDAYTKLLSHFDVAKAVSTTAATGQTLTYVQTADCSTAQKKWTASLLLNGSTDCVTVPDSDDWYLGTGDFCIDFWIYFNGLPANTEQVRFVGQRTDATNMWVLDIRNGAGTYSWRLWEGSGTFSASWASPGLATGGWYHIAVTRSGTSVRMFQAGTQCGSTYTSSDPLPNVAAVLTIGQVGGGNWVNGYIDEFRISKGIARWTANFTPPTEPYNGVVSRVIIVN